MAHLSFQAKRVALCLGFILQGFAFGICWASPEALARSAPHADSIFPIHHGTAKGAYEDYSLFHTTGLLLRSLS